MTRKRLTQVVIVVIVALLMTAAVVQAGGRRSSTLIVRGSAVEALRAAADYIDETGSAPWDVEIRYDPVAADSLWVVEVME